MVWFVLTPAHTKNSCFSILSFYVRVRVCARGAGSVCLNFRPKTLTPTAFRFTRVHSLTRGNEVQTHAHPQKNHTARVAAVAAAVAAGGDAGVIQYHGFE